MTIVSANRFPRVLLLILCAAFCAICYFFVIMELDNNEWGLLSIEEALGASLPEQSSQIEFSGWRGLGANLRLKFSAPSDDMLHFVKNFCGGHFHQSYNPFNATDSILLLPNSVLITLGNSTYYSTKSTTDLSLFGNRCTPNGGIAAQLQFVVSNHQQTLSTIELELLYHCRDCVYS